MVALLYSGGSTCHLECKVMLGAPVPAIDNARSCLELQNRSSAVSRQRSRVQTSDALYPGPRDWAGKRFWLQEPKEARALAD